MKRYCMICKKELNIIKPKVHSGISVRYLCSPKCSDIAKRQSEIKAKSSEIINFCKKYKIKVIRIEIRDYDDDIAEKIREAGIDVEEFEKE